MPSAHRARCEGAPVTPSQTEGLPCRRPKQRGLPCRRPHIAVRASRRRTPSARLAGRPAQPSHAGCRPRTALAAGPLRFAGLGQTIILIRVGWRPGGSQRSGADSDQPTHPSRLVARSDPVGTPKRSDRDRSGRKRRRDRAVRGSLPGRARRRLGQDPLNPNQRSGAPCQVGPRTTRPRIGRIRRILYWREAYSPYTPGRIKPRTPGRARPGRVPGRHRAKLGTGPACTSLFKP